MLQTTDERMMSGFAAGSETGLRLASLSLSVFLHVVLAVLFWQGLTFMQPGDEAVIVTLVEGPRAGAAEAAVPGASSRANRASGRPARRAVPPVPAATPVPPVMEAAPAVETTAAVPETVAAEPVMASVPAGPAPVAAPPAAAGDGGGLSPVAGAGSAMTAVGSGGAAGREKGEDGREGLAGLIKATPRYESNPLPPYPRLARLNRWEGTVRVRARVTARGEIESVALERSSGHAVLDRSALDGVLLWRFIPATRNGVPVACEVSIPVAFRLTE